MTACEQGDWHLRLWRRDAKPGEWGEIPGWTAPFCCRSWRHPGDCQTWRASQLSARIRAALAGVDVTDVVYLVLTVGVRDWPSQWAAYKASGRSWSRLRRRIERKYGKCEYVATVESTRRGWPHDNVVIVNRRLAAACAGDGWRAVRQWLKPHAVACGYGYVVWLEPARDKAALADYVTKLAGLSSAPMVVDATGRLGGEIAKWTQIPTDAPRNFRRVRSSRGFLPPAVPEKGDVTGVLIRAPQPDSDADVVAFAGDEIPPRVRRRLERAESDAYWAALDARMAAGAVSLRVPAVVGLSP